MEQAFGWGPMDWRPLPWPEFWARYRIMRERQQVQEERTTAHEGEERFRRAVERTSAVAQRQRGAHR